MGIPLVVLFGPIAIHAYGLLIATGVILATLLCIRHPLRKRFLTVDQVLQIIVNAVLAGIIAGRLLFLISNWNDYESWWDIISFWQGGFSVLGSMIGICLYIPWYLYRNNIPIIPTMDLLALHAPVTHAIARIGCFVSGCCYGSPTTGWWSYIYCNPQNSAPLHLSLHPTQLYSAGILLIIFGLLWCLSRLSIKPGTLCAAYLFLCGLERFMTDYVRGDREFIDLPIAFQASLHQIIAFVISVSGFILYFIIQRNKNILHYIR